MFSGIVEEMGAVASLEKTLVGTRMTILASTVMGDIKIGDSVSVKGIFLTIV
jgi:riboflavin synthase